MCLLGGMAPNIALPRPVSDLSPREQAEFLAPTLAALADVNRLTITLALSEGPEPRMVDTGF